MKIFRQTAAAFAIASLSGCLDYADTGVLTAAGATLGYSIGESIDEDHGGEIGGALGALIASDASNRAQRCQTIESSSRTAGYDHRTGQRIYDETYQTAETNCRYYSSGATPRPLFFVPE